MSVGIFTDKKVRPTEAQVLAVLGTRLSLWQEMIKFIREKYPVQEDFKFMYGQKYGWALRFRIKSQLLTNLYPAQEAFVAQLNLSPEAVEQAQGMPLGTNAQQAIARAHPYPEGRWVFIQVESAADAEDIRRLLALRAAAKRLVK